jgi:hypothetical protein
MPAHVQQHDRLRTALSLRNHQDPNDDWVCPLLRVSDAPRPYLPRNTV